MKIRTIIMALVVAAINYSCNEQLDINHNPNAATGAVMAPEKILPLSIARLAEDINTYNKYGSLMVGYQFPGDGISGFGDLYSYNFPSSSYTDNWNNAFAHLRDIQTLIKLSEADSRYAYIGAASHVLRAYTYQLLTDEYGDVPYYEGARGDEENLTPKYDDDAAVYLGLLDELDNAIDAFRSTERVSAAEAFNSNTDPLFGGDVTKWIQFSNNLKLRLLIRAAGTEIDNVVQTAFNTFSSEGFLKEDAVINPGYNPSGEQNPFYTDYHSNTAGTRATYASYYLPTSYLMTFYQKEIKVGTSKSPMVGKLSDSKRGSLLYLNFPETPNYQLGKQDGDRPLSPKYVWIDGVLKGRSQGFVAFYAFETYFLLAEAAVTGHELDGDWQSNFTKGIEASFRYLESDASGILRAGEDPAADTEAYLQENADSPLANPAKALTNEQIREAILTQKYIAGNVINGHEAWNDFRRTGYPSIINDGRQMNLTFVSYLSDSPRPDRLSVRLIYPQAEQDLNPNAPDIENSYSSPLFWDNNDN